MMMALTPTRISNTGDTEAIADEEEVEGIFEDLEELTNDAITEASNPSGGRLSGNFMVCTDISLDLMEKSITVDSWRGMRRPQGKNQKRENYYYLFRVLF